MVSLSSSSTLLAVATAALLGNVAHAVEFFAPDWVIPMQIGTPYESMTVNVGDTLTFAWSQGTHDVWIYPSGTCDNTGGIEIGSIRDNPTTYEFSEEEAGTTITFACDVGAHCQAGMIMDVNVLAAAGAVEIEAEEEAILEEIVDEVDEVVEEVVDEVVVEEEVVEEEEEEIEEEVVEEEDEEIEEEVVEEEDEEIEEEVVEEEDEEIEEEDEEEEERVGDFGPCNVCGTAAAQVTEPDFVVSLPNPGQAPFQVSCAVLYQDGLNGLIPEPSCPFIAQRAAIPCGCAATEEFSCNICGEDGYVVRNPDAEVFLPTDPDTPRTCASLMEAGTNGDLSPGECANLAFSAFVPCQCAPPDFTCSICGEGYKVGTPDALIEVPGFESTTCGELEASGFAGDLIPAQCIASEDFNFNTGACGCVLAEEQPTCDFCGADDMMFPDRNFTIPGIGLVNCGLLEAAGLDGVITPGDCEGIAPFVQRQCGCAPPGFTCNICGEDSGMVVSESDATFLPNQAVTCGQAEADGIAGIIDPFTCNAITPFAQNTCGCEEGEALTSAEEDEATDPPMDPLATAEPTEGTETTDTTADESVPAVETTETTETDESVPATDTTATDADPVVDPVEDTVEIPAEDNVEDPVVEDEEDTTDVDLVSDLDSITNSLESGSAAVSGTVAMALSCLVALLA